MNILIATDSHKDFASSREVGEWIEYGLKEASWGFNTEVIAIGDGGEGTIEALISAKCGSIKEVEVHDPLFRKRKARMGILDEGCAVVEIAQASGSAILQLGERNTMIATSYGTGDLILHALDMGCKRIIIGLGGSIVSDGGMGMAQALGATFYDANGMELHPEKSKGFNVLSLHKIKRIDVRHLTPELRFVDVSVAADVRTRLLGGQGQARTFGPQKGATLDQIEFIERGLTNWARVLEETFGTNFDIEFAGAAGGLGSGLAAFLSGKLGLGIDLVLKKVGFQEKLKLADLVVTGEGKLDTTSSHGKACTIVAEKAKRAGKKVVGVFGVIKDTDEALMNLFDVVVVSNTDGVDVCKLGFRTEIGPQQVKKAGAELGYLFLT